MKVHEGPYPMDISLLGANAVVQVADTLTHLIQQA